MRLLREGDGPKRGRPKRRKLTGTLGRPPPPPPPPPTPSFLRNQLFCRIKTDYPGVQLVHEKPYIFIVKSFLSDDECDQLLAKAGAKMPLPGADEPRPPRKASYYFGRKTKKKKKKRREGRRRRRSDGAETETGGREGEGKGEEGKGRDAEESDSQSEDEGEDEDDEAPPRSTKPSSVAALNEELPNFRGRICELTNCRQEQLQYTKIQRFERGQGFSEQLDGVAHHRADCFHRQGEPSEDYYGDRIIAEEGMWSTFNKPCVNRYCTPSKQASMQAKNNQSTSK